MSNILIQYDWNNHKEVNQKRLTDLFIELKLADKIKVYRILSDRRRLLLRKGYDRRMEEDRKRVFSQYSKYILAPLSDLIDTSELKTNDELMLTLGIILRGGGTGFFEDASPNHNVEKKSFEKLKKKFIEQYETMYMRRNHAFPHEEDSFYSKLQEVEYIPPTTLADHLKYKKGDWIQCYRHIGVGKERAERLSAALVKREKIINDYDSETRIATSHVYFEWQDKIQQDMKDEATKFYMITNHYANGD